MEKIKSLAIGVHAADPSGYQVFCHLYRYGDRSPADSQEYGPLSWTEMEQLVTDLVYRWRPGWEYGDGLAQPPLWCGDELDD